MVDKIFLIGMPGAGKTTLGKQLSVELNMNFIDFKYYEHFRGNKKEHMQKV